MGEGLGLGGNLVMGCKKEEKKGNTYSTPHSKIFFESIIFRKLELYPLIKF